MKIIASLFIALLVAVLLAAPLISPGDPFRQHRSDVLSAPSPAHPFGTDELGHDLWSLFVHGGRWSVSIGLGATLAALALSWLIGSLAGWWGGWTDGLLMWLSELYLCIPWLYLLIAARAALPPEIPPRLAAITVIALIALVSWARPSRLVRGAVLAARERGWVEAARGFGVPGFTIYRRHILPSTAGLLVTQALILLPRFVLAELTLSFLGAGSGGSVPSWGALVVPLKQAYLLGEQWWRALPLLMMLPFFALFALLARRLEKQQQPGL